MTVAEAQPDEPADARRRLGAALRCLLDVAVRADADTQTLDEAAAAVDGVRQRLERAGELAPMPLELSAIRREMSLVGGAAHPVAPQIDFAATERGSSGVTTLGPVFEGGPGLVHGGVLALLLDHAMGHAAVSAGYAAMTTELTLRFPAPTPLRRPLHVTARLERRSGRTLHLAGEIVVDGTTSVTARGVFVVLNRANVASIFGAGT